MYYNNLNFVELPSGYSEGTGGIKVFTSQSFYTSAGL